MNLPKIVSEKKLQLTTFIFRLKASNFIDKLVPFVTSLILIFRAQGLPWKSVWAEDGSVFYQQLLNSNPIDSIFHTYAGYYFVIHRVLFIPMFYLDITYLAIFITLVCFMNYYLVSLIIFKGLSRWISRKISILLTLTLALFPASGYESLQNIANLQWFWLISWTIFTVYPSSESKNSVRIYAFITIFLSYSAPSLVFMWISARLLNVGLLKGFNRLLLRKVDIVLLASSVWQFYLIFNERIQGLSILSWTGFIADGLIRVLGVSLYGGLAFAFNQNTLLVFAIPLYTFSVALLISSVLYQRRSRNIKPLVVTFLLLIPTGMGIIAGANVFQTSLFKSPYSAERYFVTSSYAFYFLIIMWIAQQKTSGIRKLVTGFSMLLMCIVFAYNFAPLNSRTTVSFQQSLVDFKRECTINPSDTDVKKIQISPPGWSISRKCEP